MTTQNIEPENRDVNETVVQQSSASGNPATSAETEVATPAQEQVTQTFEVRVEEEEIRPFTDFIEEFRQTEVRFGSLLEEPRAEPFSSLVSDEEQRAGQFGTGWANTPFGESTLLEGTSFTVEDVAIHEGTQFFVPVESNGNVAQESSEPLVLTEGERFPAEKQQPPATETEIEVATPAERPVSPLLRPASRIRLPRHASFRHREELAGKGEKQQSSEAVVETLAATPIVDLGQVEVTPVEPASIGIVPQEEQSRPARRYRFDRRTPAAIAPAPVAPAQARTEESKGGSVPALTLPHAESGQVSGRDEPAAQQQKPSTGVALPAEQPTSKQAAVQEPVTTQEAETAKETQGAPSKAARDGRRRNGHEREKAKATPAVATPAASVAEVPALTAEAGEPQAQEVAPEDLPPLEYSELQAASSRRRRRRRSGSANSTAGTLNHNVPTAAKPATPGFPAAGVQTPASPAPVSPVPVPRSVTVPGSPVPSIGQFGIISGYTVNQMNQGNDVSGPFLGPEPSPARGGTVSRTVRPIRSEAQRMPAYPARPSEATPSFASVNQLANTVVQAIQAQTDRMVSELRRANQVPTNVSVSLPPFPSTERVGVFVDVANLLYSARTQRLTIDFGKLLDFLRGNRRLVRAHAYCPTSPQPGDDQMFLQAVKGLGYRITTKDYKTFSSGAKKADLDLDLCMDVVRLVDGKAVDCIVLVSGDGDFMPMLDYCSDHGVRVEVAAFDESMSATLRQSCDLFVNLSMLEEIRA